MNYQSELTKPHCEVCLHFQSLWKIRNKPLTVQIYSTNLVPFKVRQLELKHMVSSKLRWVLFRHINVASLSVGDDCPAELYLDFGDVPWCFYSVEGGGLDPTWSDPLRLISIWVLSIDLLKHLPCQVIHSLGNNRVITYVRLNV